MLQSQPPCQGTCQRVLARRWRPEHRNHPRLPLSENVDQVRHGVVRALYQNLEARGSAWVTGFSRHRKTHTNPIHTPGAAARSPRCAPARGGAGPQRTRAADTRRGPFAAAARVALRCPASRHTQTRAALAPWSAARGPAPVSTHTHTHTHTYTPLSGSGDGAQPHPDGAPQMPEASADGVLARPTSAPPGGRTPARAGAQQHVRALGAAHLAELRVCRLHQRLRRRHGVPSSAYAAPPPSSTPPTVHS